MKTPEQQIAEVMSSLDGIGRAQAPPAFAGQVLERLTALSRRRRTIPWPKVWMAAAGLLLLLGINIYVVREQADTGYRLARDHDRAAFSESYFAPAAAGFN